MENFPTQNLSAVKPFRSHRNQIALIRHLPTFYPSPAKGFGFLNPHLLKLHHGGGRSKKYRSTTTIYLSKRNAVNQLPGLKQISTFLSVLLVAF